MTNRIYLLFLVLTIVFSFVVTKGVWADNAFIVLADECEPVVIITCDEPYELCDPSTCTTCTAETTCNGEEIAGTYTWELNGEPAIAHTGNFVEICCEDLLYCSENTLTVIDTTNDVTQSIMIHTICVDCFAYMKKETYLKSNWIPLSALIEISHEALGYRVTYECDSSGPLPSIIPLLQFKGPGDYPFKQLVIIMPSILTGNFGKQGEWCDVIIEDCAPGVDGFALDIINFGSIVLPPL